ncbi:hypothetical protein BGZ59_009525 [Podila verticillata]|nr:hypothetical protein BGZ59_009525 [Podila verticillata]
MEARSGCVDEYDDDDDEYPNDVVIPSSHPPGHTRPLLVPSRSNSGAFPSSSPSQALSSSHASNGEADDSTDTIKSMRARALNKINGRGASATASTSTRTSTNDYAMSPPRGASNQGKPNSNGINNTKRPTPSSGTSYSIHRPSTLSSTTTQANLEERVSGGNKLKRRSFGLERSNLPRITTKFDTQQPTNPPPSLVRKRNSGSFKSQQVLLTSEDEDPPGTVFQDRARYATESGGILLSELKALKARVQELEMERMNRSLSGLSVQSPQLLTPQSDRPYEEPTPLSHSEKLQNILQKHRSTGVSSPLRSPALSALPKEGPFRASTLSRVPSSTSKLFSPTQHVTLLQEAFKTYEKAMSPSTGPSSPVQAMSNVVQNAINVNQTIRTLIKADVSLVDSSSMSSLQRASDDQIRSLTEALLSLATQGPFDRTMTPSEATGSRPYSPRLSMHTRFDQGQRLSLGMVGQELGAPELYSSRPYSSAAESNSTPNLISSGYPSRTNSIASTISNDNRRSTRQGYNSDYERHGYTGVVGRYPAIGSVSREPSPPLDAHGSGQGRLSLPVHSNHQFATSTPRSTQSPRFASPGDVGDSDSIASAQVARRQASVRNILARYSQMSPTGLPRRDELEFAANDGHGGHQLEFPSPRHLPQPSNSRLSESVNISSGGTLGRSSMRPLSQQDNHNMRSSMPNIRGQLSQGRGSIRNRPVFSEDEGGWGTVSVGQLDSRSRPGYVTHSHQQEDDQGYPVGYLERSFQGHKGFSDGEGPMRQMIQRQRHQQQDMAMTTPSMSSPTSSPSTSSRLEGPSVTLSHGYGGVDGRYHLSPRGPAHPSALPRQQSLIGMSNSLLEYGTNHSGTIGRAMAKSGASLGEHAFHQQQHALDGLSPQAQAQFGHILAHD